MDTLKSIPELVSRGQPSRSMDHEKAIWDHLHFVRQKIKELTKPSEFLLALEIIRSVELVAKLLVPHYQFRDIDTSDYRAELPWRIAAAEAELLEDLLRSVEGDKFALQAIEAEASALAARNREVFASSKGNDAPIIRLSKVVEQASVRLGRN